MRTAASPHLLPLLPIDRRKGAPLHRQVYEGIRSAILHGMLRSGQRLPSTRVLAAELGVSRLPVLSAYEQLLHEGYLEARVGSGTYVRAVLPDESLFAHASSPRAMPARVARAAPRTRSEGGLRPFRVSLPALDQFPHRLWARLVARHAHRMSPAHMAYGDPAGVGSLRAAVAEHLRTSRAVRCEGEQVMIVPGSQAALRLCAAVLLRHGDAVAVEEPGYAGAHAALRAGGAELVPVRVDDAGIDVTALDALRRPIRAAYVTPSHQYPLGVSMTAERRLALLDWASRRDAFLLEDDYDSEYRYVSRPLGALQGMDADGRVVYIGTFSKVLFPALRIGYLVVPPPLWSAFIAAREALDLFSPTLYQLVLADFLHDGHFTRHLRRMRGHYLARRAALLDGIARHCAGRLSVLNADAGLHVCTLLQDGVRDTDVIERLIALGLTATALSTCYARDPKRHGLLLGFGGAREARLVRATRVLGSVLEELVPA